jgi:hypothetical protein
MNQFQSQFPCLAGHRISARAAFAVWFRVGLKQWQVGAIAESSYNSGSRICVELI